MPDAVVMPPPIPTSPKQSISESNEPLSPAMSPSDMSLKKGPPPIPAHLLINSSITQPLSPSMASIVPPLSPMSPFSPMPDDISEEAKEAKRCADRASRRTKLIAEIHETERMYSSSMTKLVTEYLTPLRSNPDQYNVKIEQINTIFSNIEQIASFHKIFYADLSTRSQPADVCHCFLKFVDFLRMYIPYVNNYTAASKVLTHLLNENKKFIKLCTEKKQTMGLDLSSYLIQPIQRIPRYELLLKELKRNLDDNGSDEHHVLDEALSKIQANAQKVNENKRQAERVAALNDVSTRVSHLQEIFPSNQSINADHRRLIKEGDLFKKSTFSKKARHYYLFNDLLIWTSPNYRYKGHLGVSDLKVQPVNHSREEEKEPHSANQSNNQSNNQSEDALGFELFHPSIKQSLVLYAESAYEYKNWLNAFNESITESLTLDPQLLTWLHVTPINQSNNRHERMRSVSSNNGRLSVFMGDLSPLSPLSPNPLRMDEVDEEDETSTNQSVTRSTNLSSMEDKELSQNQSTNQSTNQPDDIYDEHLDELDDDQSNKTNLSGSQRVVRRPSTISTTAPHTRNASQQSNNLSNSETSHARSMSSIIEITQPTQTDLSSTNQSNDPSSNVSTNGSKSASNNQSTNQSSKSSPVHSRKPSVMTSRSRTHSRKPSSMAIQIDQTINQSINQSNESNDTHEPHIDPVDTVQFSHLSLNAVKSNNQSNPSTKRSLTPAQALASLSRNDVTSLKKLKSPPLPVKLAIESCAVLLGLPPGEPVREVNNQANGQSKDQAQGFKRPNYWQPVQALLVKPTFMKTLCEFEDADKQMNEETLALLKLYINSSSLDPQLVHQCSPPAAILWQWVRSRYAKQTGEELPFNQTIKQAVKKTNVAAKIDSGMSARSTTVSRAVSKRSTPTHSRHASVSVSSSSPGNLANNLSLMKSNSFASRPSISLSPRATSPSATTSRIPLVKSSSSKPSSASPPVVQSALTPRKSVISPRPVTPIKSSVTPTKSPIKPSSPTKPSSTSPTKPSSSSPTRTSGSPTQASSSPTRTINKTITSPSNSTSVTKTTTTGK